MKKLFLALAATVAQGESRYIWVPDGDGIPHLADLKASIDQQEFTHNGEKNQYWLFTRQNQNNAQIFVHGDANTIWNSNYSANKPLTVIVHGWNSNGNSDINPTITSAFLDTVDVNIIVVDWRDFANSMYIVGVLAVPSVGMYLGNFLVWLINTAGGSWNNVHLIGFSLGAHVVGNAGRTTGRRPARITGLDPAGPQWIGNSNALNAQDAQYVEAIHTDGGLLGMFHPVGQTNFYPNGGRHPQPGCSLSTCSHSRAWHLFASSVRFNRFVGRLCTSVIQAKNNKCVGSTFNMGNSIITKQGSGLYALTTGNSWPY